MTNNQYGITVEVESKQGTGTNGGDIILSGDDFVESKSIGAWGKCVMFIYIGGVIRNNSISKQAWLALNIN